MPKRLQKNERGLGAIDPAIRTNGLILNDEFCDKVIEFIKDGAHDIRICAYAWRWYVNEPEIGIQRLNIELVKAVQRGVKVRVITDTQAMTDFFQTQGFICRSVPKNRYMHSKAICVDVKTLVIGSHNFTKRATSDNFETSIAVQEFEIIAQFVEYFEKVWESLRDS